MIQQLINLREILDEEYELYSTQLKEYNNEPSLRLYKKLKYQQEEIKSLIQTIKREEDIS